MTSERSQLKKTDIVIEPADRNLGIVVLNASDYVNQCLLHLSTSTYNKIESFPPDHLKRTMLNILIKFKELSPHKRLYSFLQSSTKTCTPVFYGIPKIHKPIIAGIIVRPIVSHSNSLLSKTALFLDYVLPRLAQHYPDFLNNLTELVKIIENVTIPEDAILVTPDVKNLYPSIPQQELLGII
uniref:Reverse transcriptase domain-containing protein n=1 Tax=Amphimedon queenslandica TaxID=400682 RepID=A0A1X7VUX7_AMPQE